MDNVIHIGIGLDRNYLKPFLALAGSLIKNHSPGQFKIHAIAEGLSSEDIRRITSLISESGNAIVFYEVGKDLVENLLLRDQWTAAVYYRLFFGSLLPLYVERLLYLDCDTLVINPLNELFQLPLDGHPVAAVYDNFVKTQPAIGIFQEGEYFNSGVLLIDLDKWRQQAISEKTFAYLNSYPDRIVYVDQCALNAVLKGNWRKLDVRFNLMYSALPDPLDRLQMKKYTQQATIIHFTLQRPWQMLCKNRFRFLYFHYLAHSGSRFFFWNSYSDFKMRKIPAWLRIRAIEFYFDTPLIQRIWRSFQSR